MWRVVSHMYGVTHYHGVTLRWQLLRIFLHRLENNTRLELMLNVFDNSEEQFIRVRKFWFKIFMLNICPFSLLLLTQAGWYYMYFNWQIIHPGTGWNILQKLLKFDWIIHVMLFWHCEWTRLTWCAPGLTRVIWPIIKKIQTFP